MSSFVHPHPPIQSFIFESQEQPKHPGSVLLSLRVPITLSVKVKDNSGSEVTVFVPVGIIN